MLVIYGGFFLHFLTSSYLYMLEHSIIGINTEHCWSEVLAD